MKRTIVALAGALVLILVGCVNESGVKIDQNTLNSFQKGVTTISQVESKLGPPDGRQDDSDNGTLLVYHYHKDNLYLQGLMPSIAGIGPHVAKMDNVFYRIQFDSHGRFESYARTGSATK